MKVVNLLFISTLVFFTGCYSVDQIITVPTIEQECEQSGSKKSLQCQILHNPEMTITDKEVEIGNMYLFGRTNVVKDCSKAKYWFERAAEQKNPKAYNGLGLVYYSCGSEKNFKKAELYYLLAIKQNVKHAKANLASVYAEGGYGLDRDYDKAMSWYKASIKDTPDRAYDGLSVILLKQERYNEALPYLIKSAELGWANAQNNLGYYYDKGVIEEQDKQKAMYWYRKAAEQGHTMAQRNLARVLQELDGVNLP